MPVPFVFTDGQFSLVLNGDVVQVGPEHPAYRRVKANLATATADELVELLTVEVEKQEVCLDDIERLSSGLATVDGNGRVKLDGKEVHSTVAARVRDFMRWGLPFEHLLRFIEHIALNPSFQAQQELYEFLENKNLPITDDGCFLAYKAVRSDYMDKYTGTIDNSPGNIVRIERGKVDDDRTRHCSKGLHCGALDYIGWYGSGSDAIVVVKVHPKDVVSVPSDCSCQKCRVCEYEVLRDLERTLKNPLYDAKGDDVYNLDEDVDIDWDAFDDDHDEVVDDYFEDGDVEVVCSDCDCCDDCDDEDDDDTYGTKPDGTRFYNVRGSDGRFA